MADTTDYVISTVTRGMCLEARPNGTLSTGVYDRTGKSSIQLWTIEQDEDGNSVAFKSVSNGKYLRSAGKGNGAKAQLGARTWWTLEPGDGPALWWVKCNDTGNYLNNYGGNQTKNNIVQLWSSNLKGWSHALQWYITPAKPTTLFSNSESERANDMQGKRNELEAREKAVEEREDKIAAREKAMADSESAMEMQAKDAESKAKAARDKEAELKRKRDELDSDQETFAKKQRQLEQREQAVASKETGGKSSSRGANSDQASVLRKELANVQQELAATKTALERPKAGPDSATRPSGSGSQYSGISTDEVVKLRSRIAELEARLANTDKTAPATPQDSGSSGRADLRPIVMKHNFSHLPRLGEAKLEYPFRIIPPGTSVH